MEMCKLRYYTNECCDCQLPCIYKSCPNYQVEHFVCDKCKEEGQLYHYNGYELCSNCVLKELDIVDGSEYL